MRLFFSTVIATFIVFANDVCAQMLPSFADLVEKLQPSVVNIATLRHDENNDTDESAFITENIDNNFSSTHSSQTSLGSGFILDKDGYIITNNHVVEGASEVSVTLADERKFKADVVGSDTKTDIALIKIDANANLQPTSLGDSDKIRVGDWILAIGNPFGLGGSVSAGIVSAKSRDIESGPYDNFIQTDASINLGSSGGPMFNLDGEVIGVNTAIFSTNGANMGIGFAMPINSIRFVISELKNKGKVERGRIGIKIQPLSQEMTETLMQKGLSGIVVSDVTPDTSAAKAGVMAGDIILKLNGKSIENARSFSREIAETTPGKSLEFQIQRDNKQIELNVLVELMPEEVIPPKTSIVQEQVEDSNEFNYLGLVLAEPTEELLNKFNLKNVQKGMIILDVDTVSDANAKGLRSGNVILQIDKKDIFDINDVKTYIDEAKQENNRPVLLLIENDGVQHLVAIKLDK